MGHPPERDPVVLDVIEGLEVATEVDVPHVVVVVAAIGVDEEPDVGVQHRVPLLQQQELLIGAVAADAVEGELYQPEIKESYAY